jgi:hypothetical protein
MIDMGVSRLVGTLEESDSKQPHHELSVRLRTVIENAIGTVVPSEVAAKLDRLRPPRWDHFGCVGDQELRAWLRRHGHADAVALWPPIKLDGGAKRRLKALAGGSKQEAR